MLKRYKRRKNFKTFIFKNPQKNIILLSNSNRRFEFVYFIFFRRWLKFFFKKTKKRRKNISCKICLVSNYWLSKKPKNSRMGKGKGTFLRHCFLIKKNQPLLITRGIPIAYLYYFCYFLKKKLNFYCTLSLNFTKKKALTITPKYYFQKFFFKKYF